MVVLRVLKRIDESVYFEESICKNRVKKELRQEKKYYAILFICLKTNVIKNIFLSIVYVRHKKCYAMTEIGFIREIGAA